MPKPQRDPAREQFWRQTIADQRASGRTIRDYRSPAFRVLLPPAGGTVVVGFAGAKHTRTCLAWRMREFRRALVRVYFTGQGLTSISPDSAL